MAEEAGSSTASSSDEAALAERGHDAKQSDAEEHGRQQEHRKPSSPPLPNEPAPPLPDEPVPPLPDEKPPETEDDGWEPVWDPDSQAFYFHNRLTGVTQWENPRVPEATTDAGNHTPDAPVPAPIHGGYNPAIHGDYDPNAPYAVSAKVAEERAAATAAYEAQKEASGAMEPDYSATGQFNRFTGRWQAADVTPENFNDESKSRRQMNAFFDVDAAANSHDGRSLKAERSGMKLSKAELKAFKEKRRERKEEKRRAWLRD